MDTAGLVQALEPVGDEGEGFGGEGFFDALVFGRAAGFAMLEEVVDALDGVDLLRAAEPLAQEAQVFLASDLPILRAVQREHRAGDLAEPVRKVQGKGTAHVWGGALRLHSLEVLAELRRQPGRNL